MADNKYIMSLPPSPPTHTHLLFCVMFCCFGCDWLKLPPQAVSELVALSDELDINEVACVELWSHVSPGESA